MLAKASVRVGGLFGANLWTSVSTYGMIWGATFMAVAAVTGQRNSDLFRAGVVLVLTAAILRSGAGIVKMFQAPRSWAMVNPLLGWTAVFSGSVAGIIKYSGWDGVFADNVFLVTSRMALLSVGLLAGGKFFGNPWLLVNPMGVVAAVGSAAAWIGAGMVATGVTLFGTDPTKSNPLVTWGSRLIAAGLVLMGAKAFLNTKIGIDYAQRVLGIRMGLQARNVFTSYAENFTVNFWQSAASSFWFFRMFPVVQAATGIDHLMDFLTGSNLTGGKGFLNFAHLKEVWGREFGIYDRDGKISDAGLLSRDRMLHDILFGQILHIAGVGYSRGVLGAFSKNQGLIKTAASYLALSFRGPTSKAGFAAAGALGFLDNILMFNVFLSRPLRIFWGSRAVAPPHTGIRSWRCRI